MGSKAITISKAQPKDHEAICTIAVKAWQAIHDGYRRDIDNDDLYNRISHNWQKRKADIIVTKMQDMPEEVIVARDNVGNILGFATFFINEKSGLGEIGNNAVAPKYQGMGIGKVLYNHVIAVFRERGLAYATVTTGYEDAGHANARAVYGKVGFKKMQTSITYSLKL
jgi:ribosomal protein S18 acetylase RimI-like enzyme